MLSTAIVLSKLFVREMFALPIHTLPEEASVILQ